LQENWKKESRQSVTFGPLFSGDFFGGKSFQEKRRTTIHIFSTQRMIYEENSELRRNLTATSK